MLEILKNRADFETAKHRAKLLSMSGNCCKYVAYVARNDIFKISDWYDDATIMCFNDGKETSF